MPKHASHNPQLRDFRQARYNGSLMDSEVRKRGTSWLTWLLWAVALTGLIYLVALTIWLGVTGLSFPYQLDYGEGVLLHFVEEWAHGRPIYKGIEGYPYITSNYAPLTTALGLIATPFLGITYAAGRLWTLLAIVALAIVLVDWVRLDGEPASTSRQTDVHSLSIVWFPALTAALVFMGSPYIYHWAPLYRVDLIGLVLSLGGLYAVWRAMPVTNAPGPETGASGRPAADSRPALFWFGALLFVAALYTKQSFVFAPAAAFAYLFLFKDRRQAVRLLASVGLLGGGLFLLINALTRGGFWESLVASNVNPFLWPEFWKQIQDFWGTFAVLGILAAWYVVDKFVLQRDIPVHSKTSPLDLYLPLSLSSLLLAGKAGAWENYFFEALAALALCAGLGLARLVRHRHPIARLVAPVAVLTQLVLMWHGPAVASEYLRLTRASNRQIAPVLTPIPNPIISEDMGLLVTNDKTLDYYAFQYSQLARAGRWDQAWELGQLRQRRLTLVILETGTRLDVDRHQRFTREFLSELDRNYRHAATVGKYELYEPDPLQHERRADFGGQVGLVGWSLDAPPVVEPGSALTVTTVWQAEASLDRDYTAFAHLVDEEGQGWATDDHQPYDGLYPTRNWGPKEMVRDTFLLRIPVGAPPGLYAIEVGWYDPETQKRLPVEDASSFRVAVVPVGQQPGSPDGLMPVAVSFGGGITLEGFDLTVETGALEVRLRWSAKAYIDTDYTVFVHLVAAGEPSLVVAQDDSAPSAGQWPTSLWLPDVPVDDQHRVSLPEDLPAGAYELLVGLYDPGTASRLPLSDGGDAVSLAELSLR